MRNPCLTCERKDSDKNGPACSRCERRMAYVRHIGGTIPGTAYEPDRIYPRPPAGPTADVRPEPTRICINPDCPHGGKPQPITAFNRTRGGHRLHTCAACMSLKHRRAALRRYAKKKEETMAKTRVCKVCGQEKPLDAAHFRRHKQCRDGFEATCKACRAAAQKAAKAAAAPVRAARREIRQRIRKYDETLSAPKAAAPAAARTVLIIDFTGREDLLEDIRVYADDELRTPEAQVLYWLREIRRRAPGMTGSEKGGAV